jgi:hypothetical protein
MTALKPDVLIVFSGGARHDWCDGLRQATKYHYVAESVSLGQRQLVCQTDVTNAHVEVYDSGGHVIGSDACAVLKRLHASNGPTDWMTWNATQAVVDNLDKRERTLWRWRRRPTLDPFSSAMTEHGKRCRISGRKSRVTRRSRHR